MKLFTYEVSVEYKVIKKLCMVFHCNINFCFNEYLDYLLHYQSQKLITPKSEERESQLLLGNRLIERVVCNEMCKARACAVSH
jgi:hypothetical protein